MLWMLKKLKKKSFREVSKFLNFGKTIFYVFIFFIIYFHLFVNTFLLFFPLDKNGTFNENSIGFDGTLQRTDMENFGVFGSEKETD